jgi:hypothetical protein
LDSKVVFNYSRLAANQIPHGEFGCVGGLRGACSPHLSHPHPHLRLPLQQIRHGVRQNTVDRLKQIIAGFNEECGTNLVKTGKKQDIIERIHLVMDQWRAGGIESTWVKAKNILSRVRSNGQ